MVKTAPAVHAQEVDDIRYMYREMRIIRDFEEAVRVLYRDSEIPGFVHLSHGQEACAVGVVGALDPLDLLTTGHRGHGHVLAKGVSPRGLMAELFGKDTGISRGFGGSMHAMSLRDGVLGANGIVGPSAAIAVGAALALKTLRSTNVCVGFFGDGALTTGSVHEALVLGGKWRIPALLVCEDNGYVEFSRYSDLSSLADVPTWVSLYGWRAVSVDGSDVVRVRAAARDALSTAREGVPTVLHVKVNRLRNHFEGDQGRYRDDADTVIDPLPVTEKMMDESDVVRITGEVAELMTDAIAYARESAYPSIDLLDEL